MASQPVSTRKRSSYTVEYKLKVVAWYKANGENKHATAIQFGLDRKRLREWLEKKDRLREKGVGVGKKRRKLHEGGKTLSAELDKAVIDFMLEERTMGRPVTNKDLRRKALECATEVTLLDSFKASPMCLKCWKQRNRVSLRCGTNDAQKVPEDYHSQIWNFRAQVMKAHLKYDLASFEIVNMDQTMCRFDMVPRNTNDIKGTRTVRIMYTRANKKGFTVALAAKGNGEKLPALVIFKERNGELGPRIRMQLTILRNVRVKASQNGWTTTSLYHWWIRAVYRPDPFNNLERRRLLVVDRYRPHTSETSPVILSNECNSDMILIPAGCTSLVQPMDVSVNLPFNVKMQEQWVHWFRNHDDLT